jgi:hypothetical protein
MKAAVSEELKIKTNGNLPPAEYEKVQVSLKGETPPLVLEAEFHPNVTLNITGDIKEFSIKVSGNNDEIKTVETAVITKCSEGNPGTLKSVDATDSVEITCGDSNVTIMLWKKRVEVELTIQTQDNLPAGEYTGVKVGGTNVGKVGAVFTGAQTLMITEPDAKTELPITVTGTATQTEAVKTACDKTDPTLKFTDKEDSVEIKCSDAIKITLSKKVRCEQSVS